MIGVFNNLLSSNDFSANNLRRDRSAVSNNSERKKGSAVITSRSKFFKIENEYNDQPA